MNIKKGKSARARDTGKKPAIGERKALRKRVVLSNTNALEVRTLQDVTKDNVLEKEVQGKMMGIPGEVIDQLRVVEAFKPTQGWSLFRRPASLMRKETIEIAECFKEIEKKEEGKPGKTIRRVLVGDKMSGKTTLVLQALMMGFLRNWVVVNLPDAKDLAIGHTEYAPLPGSNPRQYYQEAYTANLLSQIAKSNPFLSQIEVSTKPSLPIPTPAKLTLVKLAELGVANPEASWAVFCELWKELTLPGRPPIIMALDGLVHVMRNTEYLSADAKPIHAHDLTLVRHFTDHLSGKSTLANGGIILAAETRSNSPTCQPLDYALALAEVKHNFPDADPTMLPRWNPYKEVDQKVVESLKGVEVTRLNGISKEEARAIMEYYAASGMLRAKVDAPFVSERWTLAGSGNIGELERATVRLRV